MVWNRRLKDRLPARLLRVIRDTLESFGPLWSRKYYGQFGEDAVIQGIFQDEAWAMASAKAGGGIRSEPGFYVDIGAFAPIQHSNTYWFYKKGWRGINIDATPGSMRIFNRVRRRDINLELAISTQEGELTYYIWGTPNVCNTTSKEVAEKLTKNGCFPEQKKVKAQTLRRVLDECLPAGQTIDFMSVDVESHNLEVLKSNDWQKYRPRIILVEADGDEGDLQSIAASEMVSLMRGHHYKVCAWVKPTIIFKLERDENGQETSMASAAATRTSA